MSSPYLIFPSSSDRPASWLIQTGFAGHRITATFFFPGGAAVVLDTTTGHLQEITSHPVLAEWAPKGEGVYYFDILYQDDKASLLKDWGGFYFRKLGASNPVGGEFFKGDER